MLRTRGIGFAVILVVFVGLCVTTEVRAQTIVVPNALATTDGNTFLDTGSAPLRFMQIYDASQFASLSEPAFITHVTHRPDTIPGPSGPLMQNLQLFLSTTSRSVAGLSSTFAENIGADNTSVFSGPITFVSANLPGGGNTKQFDIVFPLTTPFLYDPRAGNLLLDLQVSTASGPQIRRDGVNENPMVRVVTASGAATANTGSVFNAGGVTQFTFQPIPEPSTFALASLGVVLGIIRYGWRRRKRE